MRRVTQTRRDIPYPGLAGAITGVLVLAGASVLATHAFVGYASGLMLAAPFLSGFAAAFVRSEWAAARLGDSLWTAFTALAVACLALCFTHEGPLVALMAAPPAIVLSALGALMGHSTVAHGRPSIGPVVALLMCWPLLAATEIDEPPAPRTVLSIIDVDRSFEQLALQTLGAGMDDAEDWQLIAGFARPQPAGELRLHELSEGRTRIEARTVYTLELYPERYWSLWSDAVIRRMHMQVLGEIKRQAEHAALN